MKRWLPVILGLFLLFPALSVSKAASLSDQIIATGKAYIGTPYRYGSPSGQTKSFDCSSFSQYIFAKNGISLPRSSKDQYAKGVWVSRANLQKGDLVFFDTSGRGQVSHLGVYVGNGQMIHASSSKGVTISKFAGNSYWEPRYLGAKRVLTSVVRQTPSSTTTTSYTTHKIKSGESIWIIAKRYGTTVAALKKLNGLKSDMVYVGQVLKLAKTHKVVKGESIWKIAKKYGTTVAAIKSRNSLSSNMIYAGQVLKIA